MKHVLNTFMITFIHKFSFHVLAFLGKKLSSTSHINTGNSLVLNMGLVLCFIVS